MGFWDFLRRDKKREEQKYSRVYLDPKFSEDWRYPGYLIGWQTLFGVIPITKEEHEFVLNSMRARGLPNTEKSFEDVLQDVKVSVSTGSDLDKAAALVSGSSFLRKPGESDAELRKRITKAKSSPPLGLVGTSAVATSTRATAVGGAPIARGRAGTVLDIVNACKGIEGVIDAEVSEDHLTHSIDVRVTVDKLPLEQVKMRYKLQVKGALADVVPMGIVVGNIFVECTGHDPDVDLVERVREKMRERYG